MCLPYLAEGSSCVQALDSQLSGLLDQRKLQCLLRIPRNFSFTCGGSLPLLEVSQPEQQLPTHAANLPLIFFHWLQSLEPLLSSCTQIFPWEGTIFLLLQEASLTWSPFYLFPNAQAENKQTRQILSIMVRCSQYFSTCTRKKEKIITRNKTKH